MTDEKTTEQPWSGMTCKILRVDLSSGETSLEERDERYYRKWLGGSGLIAQILLTEVPAGVDALGPENKLVFALSPVAGTPVYATGRNGVGGKSPLSGGIALCQVGETWGAELKKAGYDVLIVEGRAEKPVYLLHQGRRGHHPRRRRAVGSADQGDPGGHTRRTGRRAGPRGHDRTRRGEPGSLRLHHERPLRRRRPRRPGGGHGLEEPQGDRRAGHRPAAGVRPRGRQGLQRLAHAEALEGLLAAAGAARVRHRGTRDGGHGGHRSSSRAQLEGGSVRGGHQERSTAARSRSRMGLSKRAASTARSAARSGCTPALRTSSTRSTEDPSTRPCAAWAPTARSTTPRPWSRPTSSATPTPSTPSRAGTTIAFAMECFEKGLLTLEDTGGLELRFGNGPALVKCVELIGQA